MKNTKRTSLAFLAAAVAVLLPSALMGQMDPQNSQNPQNNQPGVSNSTPQQNQPSTMRDSLGQPGLTGQQMLDKQFIQKAAAGDIAEIQLGKLATVKGSPQVKEFAQKMVDDHTAMQKDLDTVADEIGVMLPKKMSKDEQAEYDKLNGLSGDAFDKEYILYVAKMHREDLHDFRSEASVAADPGLAAEVVKEAMEIRQHLMLLTKLAEEKGVTLPPRPQRPSAPPPAGE
jgi:putative membrane protein